MSSRSTSPYWAASAASRFSSGSSFWSEYPTTKRMTTPCCFSRAARPAPVGTHVALKFARLAKAEMPVLTPMTATRRDELAASAPVVAASRVIGMPPAALAPPPPPPSVFNALRQGWRVCSSSHRADTWALRTRIMASLRRRASAGAGWPAVSKKGSGDCDASWAEDRAAPGRATKARTSCRPGDRGGRGTRKPTPEVAGWVGASCDAPPPLLSAAAAPHSRSTTWWGVSAVATASPTKAPST